MRQSEIKVGKTYIGPRGAPKRARFVAGIHVDRLGIRYVTYLNGGRYGYPSLRAFASWADREILEGEAWNGYLLPTLNDLRRDSVPIMDIEDAVK